MGGRGAPRVARGLRLPYIHDLLALSAVEGSLPRAARQHPWLVNALRHLDSFRTDRNTWVFPRTYLQERNGSYVIGDHMRLDPKSSLELNSTFRMLRIKRLLAGYKP